MRSLDFTPRTKENLHWLFIQENNNLIWLIQHSLVLRYEAEIGEVKIRTLKAYKESQAMTGAWTRDNGDRKRRCERISKSSAVICGERVITYNLARGNPRHQDESVSHFMQRCAWLRRHWAGSMALPLTSDVWSFGTWSWKGRKVVQWLDKGWYLAKAPSSGWYGKMQELLSQILHFKLRILGLICSGWSTVSNSQQTWVSSWLCQSLAREVTWPLWA